MTIQELDASAVSNVPNTQRVWKADRNGPVAEVLHLVQGCPVKENLANNEILVKVYAAAVNPVDWKVIQTRFPMNMMSKKPIIPLLDFSGRVVSMGKNVKNLTVGQAVYGKQDSARAMRCNGALCEYLIVTQETIVPLPVDKLNFEEAAAIPLAGTTAWEGLTVMGKLKAGQRVFINGGSGGVGSFGIQIAKALGAHVETVCSTGNVELCRKLGADVVHDYKKADIVNIFKTEYKNKPFDIIFDCVGSNELFYSCHEYMSQNGIFVDIVGDTTVLSMLSILKRTILPSWLGGGKCNYKFFLLHDKHEHFVSLNNLVRENKLRPVMAENFSFTDALQALAQSATHHSVGKVTITVTTD